MFPISPRPETSLTYSQNAYILTRATQIPNEYSSSSKLDKYLDSLTGESLKNALTKYLEFKISFSKNHKDIPSPKFESLDPIAYAACIKLNNPDLILAYENSGIIA